MKPPHRALGAFKECFGAPSALNWPLLLSICRKTVKIGHFAQKSPVSNHLRVKRVPFSCFGGHFMPLKRCKRLFFEKKFLLVRAYRERDLEGAE
jgi:hypothetical protein